MAPEEAATERSGALDGVRALAALSVLAFHVWLYRDDRPRGHLPTFLDQVMHHASTGLLAFFVLSGFLLYRGFARAAVTGAPAPGLREYARRRAVRILPAYYACGAGCVVLYLTIGPTTILPSAVELPLFAVFAQNYSDATLMQLNPVLWTLAIEVSYYLVLPLLAAVALLLGRGGRHAAWLVALVGVTVAWSWLDHTYDWGPMAAKLLTAYLGHFALGMLVALWVERRRARGAPLLSARATAALMTLGWAVVAAQGVWRYNVPGGTLPRALFGGLSAAAGFALVIAAVAAGRGPATAWLRWRPLAHIGLVSYGLYLWHLPLLLVLREAGGLPQALAPRMLVVLAVALAAAELSWHFVERPFLTGRRRDRRTVLPPRGSQPRGRPLAAD